MLLLYFLFDFAVKGDSLSQNFEGVGVGCVKVDGFVFRVFCHALYFFSDMVYTLEGGGVGNQDGGDFSVVYGVLLTDEDDVAVFDAGFGHAVSFHAQGELVKEWPKQTNKYWPL
ncbi:hypothetical protein SAMN05660299_02438 [Megasphaera paucivorans]|uniref:Uncharacterized protein n=1 Tax=Megasphaera paucivorans TaxID=349095 RepID=A0A1H0A305_9FIRM|nr:hypothetical protein SAMN05660299_02438 [Megasphaera paucivorans]